MNGRRRTRPCCTLSSEAQSRPRLFLRMTPGRIPQMETVQPCGSLLITESTSGTAMLSHLSLTRLNTTPSSLQPSPGTREVSMASQYSYDEITSAYSNEWQSNSRHGDRSNVPSLIVSELHPPNPSPQGRMPSKLPHGHANFSRPVPPPISGSEEQKRQVLMRNAHNQSSTSLHEPPRSNPQQHRSNTGSPVPPATAFRAQSQASVYSSYSYYSYDAPIPSRAASATHLSPMPPSPVIAVHPPGPSRNASPTPSQVPSDDPLRNPQTAQDFLQLGIKHHLANEMTESAACFEKSATIGGGCGMGMLMWGLAQRHGWGCTQSESKGFKWLRRAAELALGDLEAAQRQTGTDKSVIKVCLFCEPAVPLSNLYSVV